MAANQAGVTALITAYSRAYHATHDSPKIFDDFLADQFYTPEEHVTFDGHLAGLVKLIDPELAAAEPSQAAALACVMQKHNGPVTLSRSRYTEDCLEEAIQNGVRQYVILGAGFDTYAYRRPDLAGQLQIFEVDHPTTQAMKRERIAAAGWDQPKNLHFVPIDFTHQSLAAVLAESAYDPSQAAFFSWLGVTFYLPCEVVLGTLAEIARLAPPRGSGWASTVVFDYMDADAFIPEKAGRRVQLMQAIARQVGEPMQCGFDPQSLAETLRPIGWRLEENLSPAQIEARYFQARQDAYHAFEHVHFARAVIA